jgi:membrane-associated phospholipid phosphatase
MFAFASRFLVVVIVASAHAAFAQSVNQPVEPKAGSWKTWVISSGKDFRVPPPPDAAATKGELDWVRSAVALNDSRVTEQVSFWDAGSPAYRWMDLITNRLFNLVPTTAFPHRVYTYVALAMYDATIAAWESKYTYNRPRPSEVDPTLRTRLATPRSPSYPSEHAATAAAAAAVLAYFLPAEADSFQALAEEAGRSRLYAGLQFPSDYTAGLELGKQVAARVIERAKADGADAVWTGTVPTGRCMWVAAPGSTPANVTTPTWKPLLLSAANEFRPAAPPACDSSAAAADVAQVRDTPRGPAAFATNSRAMYWQSPEGINFWPFVYADRWIYEDKLDQNAPRAARVYALLAGVYYDAFIASHEAKYTYWFLRPSQLEPAITPIFPNPNHPSYPSNHAVFSAARSEVLAYLFPRHADEARALGREAGESRIWAGIHYRMDLDAGFPLGRSVAQKFVAWATSDGSQ